MFYQESKTAKGAAIGTIMPWGGGITSIPKGWIVCDGQNEDAAAYPLLAQTIGDTYNSGTSSFGGDFPSYTGTIKMPNLNDKALMDFETDYFVGGNSPTGRNADEDTDAKLLLSTKIGTHESQSVVTAFTNVFTDVVFTLPEDDETGYAGRIIGNTKIDGDAFKSVYIAARKLGRKHVDRHAHPGSYPTLQMTSTTTPGLGVIPFGDVEYTIRFHAIDNSWGGGTGDTYYWGWTDDTVGANQWPGTYNSGDGNYNYWYDTASKFTAPGISVGDKYSLPSQSDAADWFPSSAPGAAYNAGSGSYGSDDHLYQLWWPDDTHTDTSYVGLNNGSSGVVLAKVESTPPPYDLTPVGITDSPISPKLFAITPDHPDGPRLDDATMYKFGLYGAQDRLPGGFRNYYLEENVTQLPSGETVDPANTEFAVGPNALRSTLMSHPGYNFTASLNNTNDHIRPHDHDEFDVEFDSSRLRSRSSITANVNIPTQTDFLGNAENKNALQIDFNVSQPQMVCVYIIRAY